MNKLKFSTLIVTTMLLSVFVFSGCSTYSYSTSEPQTVYENPQWAPDYYSNVRYYYLPDIEVYYDIYSNDFIYLNNGRWMYSRVLPQIYSFYDLYNGFVVVLDVNIYRPWMHHQYYVSHYPRYYYRDYYDRSNFAYVRGFNENMSSAIFWKENERNRARDWNDENLRSNRKFKYSSEDRRQQNPSNYDSNRTNTENTQTKPNSNNDRNSNTSNDNLNRRQPDNNTTTNRDNGNNENRTGNNDTNRTGSTKPTDKTGTTPTNRSDNTTRQQPNAPVNGADRQTQNTNYYGKKIGQTVKVEKQMRNPTTTTQSTNRSSSTKEDTNKTPNTNRSDQNTQRR